MKNFEMSLLALGLATSVVAQQPLLVATATANGNVRVAHPTAATPSPTYTYYPSILDDTTFNPDGFFVRVALSNKNAYNGHNVQLRNGIVDVDNNNSPVLKFQLRNKHLYQITSNDFGNYNYTGFEGGLQNVSTVANTTRQEFLFKNDIKSAPKSFQQSLGGWYLINLGDDGTYGLYHDEIIGVTNGFEICYVQPRNLAPYYQLRYVVSSNSNGGGTVNGCDYVGLQTTIAPIINGSLILPPAGTD